MVLRFLRRIFTPAGDAEETPPSVASVEYLGYTITPRPEKDRSGWRLAGTVSKVINGDRRTYRLDRADTAYDREAIVAATIAKAKQVIDERGDEIFR